MKKQTTATKGVPYRSWVPLAESLTKWFQENGVNDPQTAWELAVDLEPTVRRLIDANRDVVTR